MKTKSKHSILLVEDSVDFANVVKRSLKKSFADVEIVGTYYLKKDVISALVKYEPNIVLFDIELGKGTSFDILDEQIASYPNLDFELIFITGHPTIDYTIKALEYSAVSFLTKPLNPTKFEKAVSEALERSKQKKLAKNGLIVSENKARYEMLLELMKAQDMAISRIAIHAANGSYIFCNVAEITHLVGAREMCEVHLEDGAVIKAFRNIGKYRDMLEKDHNFISINRSVCINIDYLKEFNPSTRQVKLSNGVGLEASRRIGKNLKVLLEKQHFAEKQTMQKSILDIIKTWVKGR